MRKRKLVLLIKVYRGGATFRECLTSVRSSRHLFDLIVISLNGRDSREDLDLVTDLCGDFSNIVLFKTQLELSAQKHNAWLLNELKGLLCSSDRILFLCHDDELVGEEVAEWVRSLPDEPATAAWIGDYDLFSESRDHSVPAREESAFPGLDSGISLSLVDWLRLNKMQENKHVYTSISGLSVQFKVWRDVVRFRSFLGFGYGARQEYMLVAHREVSSISRKKPPMVRIREHENQAGKKVPRSSGLSDEARYCLWLLISAKTIREFLWILSSRWGVVGILKIPLFYGKYLSEELLVIIKGAAKRRFGSSR